MRRHTFIKFIVLGLYAAIFIVSILLLPQASQARDDGDFDSARLMGSSSAYGDGSASSLDGPPGVLQTGRTSRSHQSNSSAGLINDGAFSLNLVKPETHGREDDVGATAGWHWDF